MLVIPIVNANNVLHSALVLKFSAVLVGVKPKHFRVCNVVFCIFQQLVVVEIKLLKAFFNYVRALGLAVN